MAKKTTVPGEAKAAPKKKNIDLQQFLKEVEVRAYEIYQERAKNGNGGDNFSDWIQAEKEIKSKYKI
jgi:hypothetical protein